MKRVGGGFVAVWLIFSSSATRGIDLVTFQSVNNRIYKTHAPLIEGSLKGHLAILELWQDYGGAFKVDSARKLPGQNEFVVTLTGDIPHNRFMNKDGYAIVACHELGHILGGEPHQTRGLAKWSSVEGQADYYATNACMWRYFENLQVDTDIRILDQEVLAQCEKTHGNLTAVFTCLRIFGGIVAMQNYFNDTSNKENLVDYRRRDLTIVDSTLEKHPSNQCRIDTMMAGLFSQPRPACWFAE